MAKSSIMPDLADFQWDRLQTALKPAPELQQARKAVSRSIYEAERAALVRKLMQLESEALKLYEPVPLGEQCHRSNAKWRVLDGSNRACKSVTAGAEMGRAVTGQDPHDKYPKRNGFAWFVGLKDKHLSLMYDMLFKEGCFKKIKDEHTGKWRTVRWDRNNPRQLQAYDEAYREKWADAPPIIPARMVVSQAWSDKGEGVPSKTVLTSGWQIVWSSALGQCEQGQHWNLVWFDEEMPNPLFFVEAHRGLTRLGETIRYRPKGVWSATSQVSNPELANLRDTAAKDTDEVERFTFPIEDNPYIPAAERESFGNALNEDDYMTRFKGIPASSWRRVYPGYDPMGKHGCEPFDIPREWARWFITDPGMRCATLYVAIDPDEQYMTVYKTIEMRRTSTDEWAAEIASEQLNNGIRFEGAIFDQARGRQTLDQRTFRTCAEQFWDALVAAKATPRTTGNMKGMGGFYPACNDVAARERALIDMMAVRANGPFEGTCKLQIIRGCSPELDKQIVRAHTDPKNPEKRFKHKSEPVDLLEDLEYAAAANPTYHAPEIVTRTPQTSAFDNFKAKRARNAKAKAKGRANGSVRLV